MSEATAFHRAPLTDVNEDPRRLGNDILRHFGPAYLAKYQDRMSLDQIKTLKALSQCRTPGAGSI